MERVKERLAPRRKQIERARAMASAMPVPSTWQAVLREAIDRGLAALEKELAKKAR